MTRRVIDKSGQTYGHWTVVEYRGRSQWLCRCVCGFERVQLLNNLVYGASKSCGCGGKGAATVPVVKRDEFVNREFNGQVVQQRSSDGYFDATAMCKIGGKQCGDWTRLASTKELMDCLYSETGIPVSEQVVVNKGGDHSIQGTWLHPQLAMQLAQWIEPRFAMLVSRWVLDLVEGKTSSFGPRERIAPPAEAKSEPHALSQMPSLEVAEHELKELEKKTKAMRCIVAGLKKAQKYLSFTD